MDIKQVEQALVAAGFKVEHKKAGFLLVEDQ